MENNNNHRNFASISTNDGNHRVWFSSPSERGQQVITCSFSLIGQQAFLDALNQLEYLSVDAVREIGANMSHIYLHTNIERKECMLQLFDDLPSILEKKSCLSNSRIMKTYYADVSGKLLSVIEARIKELHLPVQLQYGVPYEEYDETLMHPVSMDYPDDFDLNGELMSPCINQLIEKL